MGRVDGVRRGIPVSVLTRPLESIGLDTETAMLILDPNGTQEVLYEPWMKYMRQRFQRQKVHDRTFDGATRISDHQP